jgi:hypothetical protein
MASTERRRIRPVRGRSGRRVGSQQHRSSDGRPIVTERLLQERSRGMTLVRDLFGVTFLVLTCAAAILGLAAFCLWEAKQIVRLADDLRATWIRSACRATCDVGTRR